MPLSPGDLLKAIEAFLPPRGLNLTASLSTTECARELPELKRHTQSHPSLLLVGSTGGGLWESVQEAGPVHPSDPVDHHCSVTLERLRSELLTAEGVASKLLWPTSSGSCLCLRCWLCLG